MKNALNEKSNKVLGIGNKGQAMIEAIFSLVIISVLTVALLPLYYDLIINFLFPSIENQAFGTVQVTIWQSLPLLFAIGIAFALFQFFRPKLTQLN